MKFADKFDRLGTGIISGILLPLIIGLIIYLFSAHGRSLAEYLQRISNSDIITHMITLCVFPNIAIFLIFNRLDMLKALRGVLAATIFWAAAVFIVKFI